MAIQTDLPENNTGLRSVLQLPWAYEAFQRSVGKNKLRRRFVDTYVKPKPDHRIFDIGCGPGDFAPFVEPAEYIGYDINSEYIRSAQSRFGSIGQFHDGDLEQVVATMKNSVTTAVSIGVLHHVPDDIAHSIAVGAKASLAPGGSFITAEPHLYHGQHPIAAALIKRDRGQFVRSEDGYRSILSEVFDDVQMIRDENMLRVPYTLTMYLCQ